MTLRTVEELPVDSVATETGRKPGQLAAAVARRDAQAQTDPRVTRRLQAFSRVAGVIIMITGIVVIAGWFTGVTTLTTLATGLDMKLNTGFGLALVGLSVVALRRVNPPAVPLTSRLAAFGFGLLGLATVVEYAVGRSLGFDNPFGFDLATRDAGRMAPATATSFVVMAISVVALDRGRARAGQFAGLAVMALGTFAVVGHVFGVSAWHRAGGFASMAPHTATAFVIAGLAALLVRPDKGFVALATGNTAGGVAVRRMLVPAVAGPLVVGGVLAWGTRSAALSASALALFTIAMILLSGTLVCVFGASLRHVDLRRAGAEDAFGQVDRALADRERALESLRQSEERTRLIVDTTLDAFLSIDERGLVTGWNHAAEATFGWPAEDAIGQPLEMLIILPAERATYREDLAQLVTDGPSTLLNQTFELNVLHQNGSAFEAEMTVWAIDDEGGRTFNAFARDISVRKAAESALREHEAKTTTSLDHMLDGFGILRSVREAGVIIDFEWTYINPAGAATYGRAVEALIGERMSISQPGLDESGVLDELRRVAETGEVLSTVQRAYEDEKIAGVFDYRVWKLEDGIAITWRDVTDREIALAAVQSNEERFRATIENLHEALSVYSAIRDDTGCIVDFHCEFRNAAAVEISGFSVEELAERTMMEVYPGMSSSGILDVYGKVIETGETYAERSLWHDHDWGGGPRRRRAFDVRVTKLDDGLVILAREVTEQRAQEDELAAQRLELERSNTEMRLLNELADRLQNCATADEAYAAATQSCAALFTQFSGAISVMQPSGDVLDRKANWGDPIGAVAFTTADCWALRSGLPHLSGTHGDRCGHLTSSPGVRCLCVPMMGPSKPAGVVQVMSAVAQHELEAGPARRLAIIIAGQLSMAFKNLLLRDSLREMSIRDPLTGLFNRRYLEETFDRELGLATRNKTEVGVLVIDVDYFKAFNDTHGHDAGDAILEAVGDVLTRDSRISDVACRFGGEEFIVLLPNCSLKDAARRADDVRRRVSALRVEHEGLILAGPTISCGVAAFPDHGTTSDGLIHMADQALYMAKTRGRDQVVVAPLE